MTVWRVQELHPHAISGAGSGSALSQPSYLLGRGLFLRLLGGVYLAAFVSLWVQILGLIGSQGILPIADRLPEVRHKLGSEAYYRLPTLCWFDASDAFLNGLCGAGVACSILLAAGLAPVPILLILWVCYLSVVVVGDPFLSYQWDALLLETGFLAIFLAPLQLRPRLGSQDPASPFVLWAFRWLLFRLMFASGVCKLLSHDLTWRNLTATQYHYETQPLPTWTSWYMHQLPGWFHQSSTVVMFAIELILPILVFGPRKWRLIAGAGIVFLQLLILATGNYGFFNLLTIALCVLLLDDTCFPRRIQEKWLPQTTASAGSLWANRCRNAAATGLVLVSLVPFLANTGLLRSLPGPVLMAYQIVAGFRSVNSYGLFAIMTTTRPEIIIEGSSDGVAWLPYEFKWKPGDLRRRPRFATPHLPRLDWQMWFAALGEPEENLWLFHLLVRLLQGSPDVTALLEHTPFPEKPPRHVRAMLYEYHFTGILGHWEQSGWWRRELKGPYGPVLTSPDEP
jgi:hypothetical protein